MTTSPRRSERPSRRRHISRLAIIVAAALPIAACSSSSTSKPDQTDPTTPATPATAPSTTAPSTTALSTTALSTTLVTELSADDQDNPPGNDAYDRLDAAISQLGTTYTFETHTTLDGVEVSTATGRRVGDATEITLDQQGTGIVYRTVAERRWVQLPDGQWKTLNTSNAPSDPLQQISQPTQLDVTTDDGTTVTMTATYDAKTFSLTATSELIVTLTLTDNTLTEIEYETQQSGRVAHVRSVFRPADNLEPIPAP